MRELWRQVSGVQERCGPQHRELAEQAEISEATIKLIERSKTVPQLATIVALLRVSQLGLTLDDLPQRYRDRAQVISLLPSQETEQAIRCCLCKTAFHSCGTVAEHCRPPAPTTWTCRS